MSVQDQNSNSKPDFCFSLMGAILSTPLGWQGDAKDRVGKMMTQSNSCQSWQKAIGLFESKNSGSDFYDSFTKRRFVLLLVKDISQKEKRSQGLFYISRA